MTDPHRFDFRCYGVAIRINANDAGLVVDIEREIRSLIPGVQRKDDVGEFAAQFDVTVDADGLIAGTDHKDVGIAPLKPIFFFHALSTHLRVTIAENSPEYIFVHAGAVSWKGKGIVIPGDSFAGKTTLVTELVRLGAEYYSDDFALFDDEGRLHPFPRPLSIRAENGRFARIAMPVSEIGGRAATTSVDVGTICLTHFEADAQEKLTSLSAGEGVLELMKYTFSFIERPRTSMPVLQRLATDAAILSGARGEAAVFAKTLLDFVDNAPV